MTSRFLCFFLSPKGSASDCATCFLPCYHDISQNPRHLAPPPVTPGHSQRPSSLSVALLEGPGGQSKSKTPKQRTLESPEKRDPRALNNDIVTPDNIVKKMYTKPWICFKGTSFGIPVSGSKEVDLEPSLGPMLNASHRKAFRQGVATKHREAVAEMQSICSEVHPSPSVSRKNE